MSLGAMTAVFQQGTELTGTPRTVLLVLAEHTNGEDGRCFPSVARIARRAGLKRTETAREALRWLEANGYIERRLEAFPGTEGQIPKGKRPNVYLLTFNEDGPTGPKVRRTAKTRIPGNQSDEELTRDPGNHDSPRNASSDYPDDGEQNPHLEPESMNQPPPNPPGGEPDANQPPLDPSLAPAARPKRSRRRKGVDTNHPCPRFDAWWIDYPNKHGDRKKAKAAWLRAERDGFDVARFEAALKNYLAALEANRSAGGDPQILLGTTFLNGSWSGYEATASPNPAWPKPRTSTMAGGPSSTTTLDQQKDLSTVMAQLAAGADL